MAELCRVTNIDDQVQTFCLTFILPSAITVARVSSRRFTYAGHRWRLDLWKNDRHVAIFLVCCEMNLEMRCTVDFTITLINRGSFTQNEKLTLKDRCFGKEKSEHCAPSHGCPTSITIDDLLNRNFSDCRGDYVLELILANPRTVYSSDRSTVFQYGGIEWLCGFDESVTIVQKNGTDQLCKLQWSVSGQRDNITDVNLHKLTFIHYLTFDEKSIVEFKDNDKQTWRLVKHTDHVILKYVDYCNIPENYLRYVRLCLRISDHVIEIENFYSRYNEDEGRTIVLEDQDQFTVEIEFFDSHLLYNTPYTHNDDIYSKHLMQMRRDIDALEAENEGLERELRKYRSRKSVVVTNRSKSLACSNHVVYNR